MNNSKRKQVEISVPSGQGKRQPVTVRLKRVNANLALHFPPSEEERKEWEERLKAALGTCSSAFVEASMAQLIAACRLPGSGTSEVGVNAALAFIEGVKPENEMDAALAIQMAATHSATMGIFSRYGGDFGGEHSMVAGASALARLLKAFATQLEVLRRIRNGGTQVVRVEHVHIHEGAQAVIGTVSKAG